MDTCRWIIVRRSHHKRHVPQRSLATQCAELPQEDLHFPFKCENTYQRRVRPWQAARRVTLLIRRICWNSRLQMFPCFNTSFFRTIATGGNSNVPVLIIRGSSLNSTMGNIHNGNRFMFKLENDNLSLSDNSTCKEPNFQNMRSLTENIYFFTASCLHSTPDTLQTRPSTMQVKIRDATP